MTTVLVTCAGGAVTLGLIRRLQSQYGYRVIATDMDPHAVGLYWADMGFVVPPGGAPDYLLVMRHICEQEQVDVVVPLADEELLPALELESYGFKVLLPRREFVRTCLDKFVLMQELAVNNIQVPTTILGTDDEEHIPFPVIVKPRVGHGSRGIDIARSAQDLALVFHTSAYTLGDLIVQSYIEGTEFTVSVVAGRDGCVHAVVPKEVVCKRGITRIAITRHNEKIDAVCRKIQNNMRADGPFNVQLVLDKKTGLPTVFEINPRFSTTTLLTTEAGVDEVGGLIRQFVYPNDPKFNTKWKEGVVLLRRTLDEFVDVQVLYDRSITSLTDEATQC